MNLDIFAFWCIFKNIFVKSMKVKNGKNKKNVALCFYINHHNLVITWNRIVKLLKMFCFFKSLLKISKLNLMFFHTRNESLTWCHSHLQWPKRNPSDETIVGKIIYFTDFLCKLSKIFIFQCRMFHLSINVILQYIQDWILDIDVGFIQSFLIIKYIIIELFKPSYLFNWLTSLLSQICIVYILLMSIFHRLKWYFYEKIIFWHTTSTADSYFIYLLLDS